MLTTRVARARSCTLIRDEIYTPSEMRTRRKGTKRGKGGERRKEEKGGGTKEGDNCRRRKKTMLLTDS